MAGLLLLKELAVSIFAGVLIPRGTEWAFLDDGSPQGFDWRTLSYDDRSWRVGAAQLGYGEGDETTRVSFGTNASNKHITTYFRHRFNVSDPSRYRDVTLGLLCDDGAAVYLNGQEIFRSNLPAGQTGYRTLALTSIGGSDETTFVAFTFSATNLVEGANILAVEVHQAATNSSDLSFDLELVANYPRMVMSLMSPSSATFSSAANLGVALEDVSTTNVVTIYGRPAGTPPGPDFTIVALPDTQYYVSSLNGGRPETFVAQTDWIVANKLASNIAFVTQLGDCVENGDNNPLEWHRATNALYRLENPLTTFATHGIPYGVAVGNHDQSPAGSAAGTTRFYNDYFGEAHFAGRDYYGGHFGTNNDNHFQVFSASGLDFIVIHLEFDPGQNSNVLQWANQLLETHRNRRAIVVSHYLITTFGGFGPQGQKVFDGLKHNTNLFLMLCGHEPGEGQRTDVFDNHTIHTVLSDFQARTNGGSGFLRLLEFSPSNNVIRVRTYSPTFDSFETDATSQFTLDYDMRGGESFTAIASFTDVCADTNLSFAWNGLAPNADYEWYVEAQDGETTQRGPVWRFTTGSAAELHPLRLSLARAPNGHLALSWPTAPGLVYQVMARSDLNANWAPFSDEITAADSALTWTIPVDSNVPQRFFAVKLVR